MKRLAIFAAVSLLWGAPATAQERGDPALAFAEDALSVTLEELRNGKPVTVLNQRATMLRARLRLSDLGLEPPTPPPEQLSTAASIPLPTVVVPAAGERQVVIRARGLEVAEAVYAGRLAVYETETGTVSRIPFKLDARRSPSGATEPAVEKLEHHAFRPTPFGAADRIIRLPLAVPTVPPSLKKTALVGVLGAGDGAFARVSVAGAPTAGRDGVGGVDLAVSGLEDIGTYAGKLDLTPDEEGGQVDLSIEVRDRIWWAALVLLAGIALALWRLHWTGAARAGFAVERRRSLAEAAYAEAMRRFRRAGRDRTWRAYDPDEAYRRASEDARALVVDLGRKSFDELDEDRKKKAEDAIAGLEGAAAAVRKLEQALPRLEQGLAAIRQLERVPGLPGPAQPTFAVNARDLLKGGTLESLSELEEVAAAVTTAAALASRWPLLHADAVLASSRVRPRPNPEEDEAAAVAAARRRLVGAWLVLNDAPDAAVIAERRLERCFVDGLLAAAEAAPADAPPLGKRATTLSAIDAGLEAFLPTLSGGLAGLPADPERRARSIEAIVRRGDRLVVLLAGLLALYSGLETLYFDKAFGSVEDYIAAFLWGATVAGAVDLLAQALRTRLSPLS